MTGLSAWSIGPASSCPYAIYVVLVTPGPRGRFARHNSQLRLLVATISIAIMFGQVPCRWAPGHGVPGRGRQVRQFYRPLSWRLQEVRRAPAGLDATWHQK